MFWWMQVDNLELPHRFERTLVDPRPTLTLDLSREEIQTMIWAIGYRPDYA